uniref:Uncharacterized protein n=1 Tax=Ascaris lumbricoides TaxID=6252 RepID=A0A0M3IDC2_ASCLU
MQRTTNVLETLERWMGAVAAGHKDRDDDETYRTTNVLETLERWTGAVAAGHKDRDDDETLVNESDEYESCMTSATSGYRIALPGHGILALFSPRFDSGVQGCERYIILRLLDDQKNVQDAEFAEWLK